MYKSEPTIGGSTTDLGSNTAATIDPFVKVTGAYRQYRWDLFEPKFKVDRNMKAGQEAKMFDMLAEDLNVMKQAAHSRIATHLYADGSTLSTGDAAGSTPALGLEAIIDDDNTYFGVARGSNAYIQAQVDTTASATFTQDSDNDGTADGLAAMDTLWVSCTQGRDAASGVSPTNAVTRDAPDLVLTNSADYLKFKKVMQPQQRYAGGSADPDIELTYMGVPVVWDSFCTASRFYFLNSRHLNLDIVPGSLLEADDPIRTQNPLGNIYIISTQMQFYSKNPRYLGSLQLT